MKKSLVNLKMIWNMNQYFPIMSHYQVPIGRVRSPLWLKENVVDGLKVNEMYNPMNS